MATLATSTIKQKQTDSPNAVGRVIPSPPPPPYNRVWFEKKANSNCKVKELLRVRARQISAIANKNHKKWQYHRICYPLLLFRWGKQWTKVGHKKSKIDSTCTSILVLVAWRGVAFQLNQSIHIVFLFCCSFPASTLSTVAVQVLNTIHRSPPVSLSKTLTLTVICWTAFLWTSLFRHGS